MKAQEILDGLNESFVQVSGRVGGQIVRKYRCTSGFRKGRIVSKPSTCTAPRNIKRSVGIKKMKSAKGTYQKIKTQRTKTRKTTSRLRKLNVHSRSTIKPQRTKKAR